MPVNGNDLISDLISLFDDRDKTVTECVDRKLMEFGHGITAILEDAAGSETDEGRRILIERRRREINGRLRMHDLQSLSRSAGTAGFSLYETVFAIASLIDPDFSRDEFQSRISEYSTRLTAEISPVRTAYENVEIFNHIFFNVLGFKVLDNECTELEYALLPRTLSTRSGNPFTVSLIYFLIAAEAGMPVLPLCIRGGFIPAYVEGGRELFYINMNDEGRPFNEATLRKFLGDDSTRPLLHGTAVLPGIWMESIIEVCRRCGDETLMHTVENALSTWTDERYLDGR